MTWRRAYPHLFNPVRMDEHYTAKEEEYDRQEKLREQANVAAMVIEGYMACPRQIQFVGSGEAVVNRCYEILAEYLEVPDA